MTNGTKHRWVHDGPDYHLRIGSKWVLVGWHPSGLKVERTMIAKNGDVTELPYLKRHGKRSWLWPHGAEGLAQAKKEALRWLLSK